MKAKVKELIWAVVFVVIAALLIWGASRLLRPVRTEYGATWDAYLKEPRDSLDYLYFGSSYAYCDVDPAAVYDESGLTGFVLAGPEQTLGQTYWYLREALKTQSPQLVVVELTALEFQRYQNYTQVNVAYMPPGLNRAGAALYASEPELRTGLFFDLYFYHSRWNELTLGEAKEALLGPSHRTIKGYTPVDGAFEHILEGPYTRPDQPEEVYQANLADLEKLMDLCRRKNVPLALVLHPTYSQLSPGTRARIRADLTAYDPEVTFWDWTEDTLAIGLDPAAHYYDPGHLNRSGAALFSHWLGDHLTQSAGLVPRPQSPENEAVWSSLA